MVLYEVSPGDVGQAEDVNQYHDALTVDIGSVQLKKFTDTISPLGSAVIPHGLGRIPFSLTGYWSNSPGVYNLTPNSTAVRWGTSSNANLAADETNVYMYNANSGQTYTYTVFVM